MLPSTGLETEAWRTAERRCNTVLSRFYLGARTRSSAQGGTCRLAWWAEHRATEACRCGRECVGDGLALTVGGMKESMQVRPTVALGL